VKDGSRITRYSPFRTEGREKGKKYPGGVRVGGGTLLTSLNMFQHPSATRSIASLSVDTDARQAEYPPALSTSPSPSRFPYSRNPSALHRRSTTSPFPPPPRRAFYRRLCVLRQWQTDLNLPLRPYRQPSIPSFYLSRRGRPPFNDVTGCPTLRFTKFIYRSSRILYICVRVCMYICI